MKAQLIRQAGYGAFLPLALLFTFGSAAIPACGKVNEKAQAWPDSARYRIFGDIRELAEEGRVVVNRATGDPGESEELGRASLAGGRFELQGEVDYSSVVQLVVYGAAKEIQGAFQFILEPGEIRIGYRGEAGGLIARGGKYQQQIVASWEDGEEYQRAVAAYDEVLEKRKDIEEGDERYEELTAESWKRYAQLYVIRNAALRAAAESNEDPQARLHALEFGALGGEETLEMLDQLQAGLGDHPALAALRRQAAHGMETATSVNENALPQGAQVKDFSSTGLNGIEYHLSEARAHNQYTLIEFWASWCAPCRTETPHIIASYRTYKPKGFEVFAFSLDHDRDDWATASEEDGIPWINTSDLKVYDSPVTEQFGINAIPTNFLLDSDGVIVATNLLGEALNEKLAELIDGVAPPGAGNQAHPIRVE